MTRRHFLAALLFGGLAGPTCSAPALSTSDYRLQREILRTHQLLSDARTTYQNWLSGRLATAAALGKVAALERPLLQAQDRARRWSLPTDASWLSASSRQQVAELAFFRSQLQRKTGRQDLSADLQQRWLAELELRKSWLQARRLRVPLLLQQSKLPPDLRGFYQWQARVLELESAELDLAEELARSFRASMHPAENWTRRGLQLHQRALALRVPASVAEAQRAVLARFAALSRLCQSASQYRVDPGADSATNLQEDEKSFQALALRSEQVALEMLRKLLKLEA